MDIIPWSVSFLRADDRIVSRIMPESKHPNGVAVCDSSNLPFMKMVMVGDLGESHVKI